MKTRAFIFSVLILILALFANRQSHAQGAIVWSGPVITFTNLPGSDWTQPPNQDRLTANIWLTRAPTRGLFNAASEGFYTHNASPADTEWAIGLLANYSSLTYTDWENTYGGQNQLSGNIIGQDAVLHLVTADIYLGIQFISWGGPGGGFTYERTTPLTVPEPPTGALAFAGTALLIANFARKTFAP